MTFLTVYQLNEKDKLKEILFSCESPNIHI
jgi:hypothetical protein